MTRVERRKQPRVHVDLPLQLTFRDSTVATQIRDLSTSGIRFRSPSVLPLLSRVQIALELPEMPSGASAGSLAITGVVVRSDQTSEGERPAFDTAIYFEDLSERARSQLSQFIASRK
jgi:c-di-GMP-binding flagellar brake protein YcgR